MFARIRSLLGLHARQPVPDRTSGLNEEVAFWRSWFQTKGLEWPDDYARRFDPHLPLQEELARLALEIDSPTIRILDVGAGPVTRLGKRMPGKIIELVPTDFLANEYNKVIDELGVKPLLRTAFANAETLVGQFGPSQFHIVHAQNCVDHMENAGTAIQQMVEVLRPGGVLYLRHEENEGRRTGYQTIHLWDFALDDASGHFVISHAQGKRVDVTQRCASTGTIRTYREGNRVVFELKKHA